jgi:hypothetical protein
VVMGVQFDGSGQNLSSQQIKNLYDSNSDVKNYFNMLNAQQSMGQPQGQVPGVQASAFTGTGTNMGMPASAATPSAMMAQPLAPPGERLLKALQDAAGINVGAATAPKLMMIADPNCPYCEASWKALRDAVFANKLQVRLVPIDAGHPDSERAAAEFLHTAVPLEAWDKYVAGDKSQLAGTPDETSLAAVRANRALVESWHIQQTPFFVYRGKDGEVKILQGQPEKVSAILDDIGS